MTKILFPIGIVILIAVIIVGYKMSHKIGTVIQADKRYFSQLHAYSKAKYILKAAYNIAYIDLHSWNGSHNPEAKLLKDKKVLLLGASIGQYWYINEYFKFVKNIAVYRFDKREALEQYFNKHNGRQKPDTVIVKECAAFIPKERAKFEQNFDKYKEIYQGMVHIVKENHSIPIVATVVPITTMNGRLENILEFNDWVRGYARENSLEVLDLEKALIISGKDRRLRTDLSQEDGLHINRRAYEKYLNPLIVPLIMDTLKTRQQDPLS